MIQTIHPIPHNDNNRKRKPPQNIPEQLAGLFDRYRVPFVRLHEIRVRVLDGRDFFGVPDDRMPHVPHLRVDLRRRSHVRQPDRIHHDAFSVLWRQFRERRGQPNQVLVLRLEGDHRDLGERHQDLRGASADVGADVHEQGVVGVWGKGKWVQDDVDDDFDTDTAALVRRQKITGVVQVHEAPEAAAGAILADIISAHRYHLSFMFEAKRPSCW